MTDDKPIPTAESLLGDFFLDDDVAEARHTVFEMHLERINRKLDKVILQITKLADAASKGEAA